MTRYVVGIDLGTSNSAIAYASVEEVREAERPVLHQLAVPQLVAAGDLQSRSLLPSSMYLPAGFELREGDTALPWASDNDVKSPVVGEAAKRLGAKTPVRLVESAKSWLCHGGVNRTASILPWHAPDEVPKCSPVDAAAAYLSHLRAAWNHEFPDAPLEEQTVVVTVPASFDEIARRLTLDAAKKARLANITLIEEPLAAFYAYIARTGGTTQTTGLKGGERIVIADVGGGTTDFTMVEVQPSEGDALKFERTAVGDHLLLGGDNMDLALAHAVEPLLSKGKKLDAEGWAQLKLECRLAKETLFTHLDKASLPVVVTGRGSKLIGGTMRAELTRELLESTLVDGYFPALPPGEAARPKRAALTAGFSEVGLPYASDPGITRHLAAFLMRHAREGEKFAHVDAILFNGGALKPTRIRDRVSSVLGAWMRQTAGGEVPDPRPLIYDEGDDVLELAVARGAAYFGLVREGLGLRVGGGSPRAYFLGLGGEEVEEGSVQVLCVAPRGMQDGQRIEVNREFSLVTNRPVEFPIYATTSPRKDAVGSVLTLAEDELDRLPPLQTVVKFGKQKAGTKVPVRIQVKRTELGTLELSCLSKMSGARFLLEFDVRAADVEEEAPAEAGADDQPSGGSAVLGGFGGAGSALPVASGEVAPEKLEAAKARIDRTFKAEPPREHPDALMKGLEEDFGLGRNDFPISALRALGEHLLERMDGREIAKEHETRWLNLAGFCLRPGFGVPVDDWRVRQLWKVHGAGLVFPAHDPCQLNWWILWRRVAGGLSRGHQEELASRVFPLVIPSLAKRAKGRRPPKVKSQEAVEAWRAAASLERIGAKSRAQLGEALLEMLGERKAPRGALWCLGRIGARKLLYGPREATVRQQTAVGWVKALMALPKWPKDEHPASCLVSIARVTGDRQYDLPEEIRRKVNDYLVERGVPEAELRALFEVVQVDAAAQGVAFGDGLPPGLTL
ncbi:MAG: Hsp70 family protein [Deltaproteobacteria bacterium]